MKNIFLKLKPQYGITLVEILIALFITTVITAAAMEVYLTQHKSYLWQEQISDMNQNAQFARDELTKRIANIGYGMPAGRILDINGAIITNCVIAGYNPSGPDTITIISKAPIDGISGFAPYGGAVNQPLVCGGIIDSIPTLGYPFIPVTFEVGNYGVVSDLQATSEIFQAIDVENYPEIIHITSIHRNGNWAMNYPAGSYVTKIEYYKYYLNTTTRDLMLITESDTDTVIIAPNVDSLNFTYTYHLESGHTPLNVLIPNIPPEMVNVRITVRTERMKKDVYGNPNMDSTSGGYAYKNISSTIKIRNRGIKLFW
jgi:hypothetical protein